MTHRTPYRMTFRGTAVDAEPGQSVAAALVTAGILDWRTTRKEGRPRGLFCGIGVCFDCLISVDGAPAERACLIPAADGMRLGEDPRPEQQGPAADPDAGAARPEPEGPQRAGREQRNPTQEGGDGAGDADA